MSAAKRPKTNEIGCRSHMRLEDRNDMMTPEREKRARRDLKDCKTIEDTVSCAVSNRDAKSIISKNKE